MSPRQLVESFAGSGKPNQDMQVVQEVSNVCVRRTRDRVSER